MKTLLESVAEVEEWFTTRLATDLRPYVEGVRAAKTLKESVRSADRVLTESDYVCEIGRAHV